MIRNWLGERSVLFSASLYLVASLVCAQLPLLNYLGYEFSIAIALLGSFVAGFLTITSVKQLSVPTANSQQPIASVDLSSFKHSLFLNFILLVIPLAVMFTNAFFVKNCSLLEGLSFFLLLPVVSVVFSTALGFFCTVHYRWAKTVFVLIFLATIAEVLALGYFAPAIFSYNFFFGYFPGLTYDEALGIGLPLVLFRLLTLILAAALVWMTLLLLKSTNEEDTVWEKGAALLGVMVQGRNVFVTAAIATMIIVTWWFRGELRFDSSSTFIQKKLGEKYETEHFRIFYSRDSYNDTEIRWIAAEHEFRLKQIADVLSLSFKGEPKAHEPPAQKIESYIYPSSDVKQRLMGAGNTNIAKPWSQQIHITKQSLDGTMKHELVHLLVAPFGLPIINASLSTGLVEGVAMAIEWDWGNRTPHQYAAAMKKFGVSPDISSMMTITGFASQSSSVGYVLAGSFCRYLIDTYGIRDMMLLYRSNDYDKIYNKSLSLLISEWQTFLGTIPIADQDRDAVDVLFRRPQIFKKVCARVIAARTIEAAKKFGQKDYKSAAELYHQSFDNGRGYDALGGYISSELHAKEFHRVTAVFDTVIRTSQNPAQYLPLYINIGLAHYGKGDFVAAQELFRRVETADLGESVTEASFICAAALRDTVNRETLLRYFITASNDSERVMKLDSMVQHPTQHWLPLYLKGKVYSRLQQWDNVLTVMKELEQSISEEHLEAIRLKTMGYALFRLRRFEEAKVPFWNSLNYVSTEAAQNDINDWVERCEWMKTHALLL